MQLHELGWNAEFAQHYAAYEGTGVCPARVVREQRRIYTLSGTAGDQLGEVSGRFAHERSSPHKYPTVGDWVVAEATGDGRKAIIHAVLPRRSRFSRLSVNPGGRGNRRDGGAGEQVVAANIDLVFLVVGLDGGRNFNIPRLERYLTLAWESGASPVVVLNKADLCENPQERRAEAQSAAPGVAVHVVSATRREGIEELAQHLDVGVTAAFLGPSGVGKSSLVNALRGEASMVTEAVRDGDLRGRHTTTHRELLFLACGGMLIDTPGMRELQVWGSGEGLARSFEDIEDLSAQCRFSDCRHEREPGCAVKAALADGSLTEERYRNYTQLAREYRHGEAKRDAKSRRAKRESEKRFTKMVRRLPKKRR